MLRQGADRALPGRSLANCRLSSAPTGSCCAIRPRSSSPAASAWFAPLDPDRLYDVAIVGAGPAGLARPSMPLRRVFRSLVLDCRAFGGQAGASARIENYLGFPTGISGMALMGRAYNQAQKFGAEMVIPAEVEALECNAGAVSCFDVSDGERVTARIGRARRRRALPPPRRRRTSMSSRCTSVHYWASPLEGNLCAEPGGGAGRRRQFGGPGHGLSGQPGGEGMAARARQRSRGDACHAISSTASRGLPNVEVLTQRRGHRARRQRRRLEAVRWRQAGGDETRRPIRHLFLFIGADPNTDWLAGSGVALDAKGFVLTGKDPAAPAGRWKSSRARHLRDRRCARGLGQARRRLGR